MIVKTAKSVSINSGSPSLGMETETKGKSPQEFFDLMALSKMFVKGSLLQGSDPPEQATIDGVDRFKIIGPFKLGKFAYDSTNKKVTFKASFELGSLELNDLEDVTESTFFLDIKDVSETLTEPATLTDGIDENGGDDAQKTD